MKFFLATIFLLVVPALVINRQYKVFLILCLLSLINNLFFFNFFGTRIPMHSYIALCSFPFILPYYLKIFFKRRINFLHILSLEFLSLVVLGIIFSVIYPWPVSGEVSWNQIPSGRSIVALFRFFLDIALVVFVHFCITKEKIKLEELFKAALLIAIFQIGIGFIDYFANYPIRSFFFTERQIPGRYLGFSHEPRSMARNTSFVLLLLLSARLYKKNRYNIRVLHLVILLIGILFTFSVSSMIALTMSCLLFFLIKNKKNRLKYFIGFVMFFFIAFQAIKTTDYYKNHIIPRVLMVTLGGLEYGVIKGEPLVLTRLEVMDRAAANFFYRYPKYLIFGTGPNLIGLPSSPYRTKSALKTFGKTITAVPGTGLIYTLGRNGFLGLFILFLLYKNLARDSKHNDFKSNLLFFTFFYFLFIHPSWFFFNIGLINSHSLNE